jgi:hypothetical protein
LIEVNVLQKKRASTTKKMALMAMIVALLEEVLVEALGSGFDLFLPSSKAAV